jgi:RimJ/RimL family protein N-acetyltransferase
VAREALPEEIDTPRLRLRAWTLSDVDDVFSYAQDAEWSRFLRILPRPYTRADAERFISGQLLLDRITHPALAIELGGRAVGGIDLRFSFEHP